MSFIKKIWKDRVVDAPGRRKLKDTSTGIEQIVDVSRAEGEVVVEGDKFDATTMNDLEQRVEDAITVLDNNVEDLDSRIGGAELDIDSMKISMNVLTDEVVDVKLRVKDLEENGTGGGGTPTNLADVAYSGDYNDLINKPDLSNVGGGTYELDSLSFNANGFAATYNGLAIQHNLTLDTDGKITKITRGTKEIPITY